MRFPAQLEDGTIVEVEKAFDGDSIVLRDEAGNTYQQAQFGAHILPLAEGETAPTAATTDTEPVAEETEPEAAEEVEEGGVTEEPVG
jgi:hypothetical protein